MPSPAIIHTEGQRKKVTALTFFRCPTVMHVLSMQDKGNQDRFNKTHYKDNSPSRMAMVSL